MSMTMTKLPATVQQLIDARLDSIDRILLSTGTSRQERHDIISSVEDQIMELVASKCPEDIDRECMVQILASLDPPEAYLTESDNAAPRFDARPHRAISDRSEARTATAKPVAAKYNMLSLTSFILAIASILWVPPIFVFGIFAMALSVVLGVAAFVCGLVAITGGGEQVARRWMAIIAVISLPLELLMFIAVMFLFLA